MSAEKSKAAGVRHVVMFKFKEGSDKAAVGKLFSDGLAELPGKISEIKRFVYGPDIGLDPARNHDFVVVADFDSAEDYKTYAVNADHQAFVEKIAKPNIAPGGRCAVQYTV